MVDLEGYIIIMFNQNGRVRLYGSPGNGNSDTLEVQDEILEVNGKRDLETEPQSEVIRYIYECIESRTICLRIRRRPATLNGLAMTLQSEGFTGRIRDAWMIAVESRARDRLKRLSRSWRVEPRDMHALLNPQGDPSIRIPADMIQVMRINELFKSRDNKPPKSAKKKGKSSLLLDSDSDSDSDEGYDVGNWDINTTYRSPLETARSPSIQHLTLPPLRRGGQQEILFDNGEDPSREPSLRESSSTTTTSTTTGSDIYLLAPPPERRQERRQERNQEPQQEPQQEERQELRRAKPISNYSKRRRCHIM